MFFTKFRTALMCTVALSLLYGTQDVHAKEHFKPKALLLPKVPSNGANTGDGFGSSVWSNGKYKFVAASFAQPNGVSGAGCIYVYKREGEHWTNTQIISTGGLMDELGLLSVVAQENWLIFSAIGTPVGPITLETPLNQDLSGAAVVYHLNQKSGQWELAQIINRQTNGLAGLSSIAIPTLLNITNNTMLTATVSPFLTEQGASFGLKLSMDIQKKVLLVGASCQEFTGNAGGSVINAGAVYAFTLNERKKQWILQQTIKNPDGDIMNERFGFSVAVKGDLALVGSGAWLASASGLLPKLTNSAVYLYQRKDNTWNFIQKVIGNQVGTTMTSIPFSGITISVGDAFGSSLALTDKWAIVGAGQESQSPSALLRGAIYFYKITDRNGLPHLEFKQKFFPSDPVSFGLGLFSVDIRGKLALAGDPSHPGPLGTRQGAVFVYQLEDGKWKQTSTLFNTFGEAPFACFGSSVSIGKDHIIVGQAPMFNFVLDLLFGIPPLSPYLVGDQTAPDGKAVIFKRN